MSPAKVPSASAGLLAYLVLHPKPVTREHLASLLWPKAESSKARHSLRQLLTRIRKVFPDVLVTDKERIGVDPDRIQVDVHQFEEDIRERRLRSALALWQGPFLEGWSWPDSWELEDWVERERSRLWRLLEQAFLEAGEALLSAARPTDALELLDYCQWHPSAPVVFYQLWGDDEPEIYRSEWGAKGPHLNLSRHVTADKEAVIMGVNR